MAADDLPAGLDDAVLLPALAAVGIALAIPA
jgi:hypothetical protein